MWSPVETTYKSTSGLDNIYISKPTQMTNLSCVKFKGQGFIIRTQHWCKVAPTVVTNNVWSKQLTKEVSVPEHCRVDITTYATCAIHHNINILLIHPCQRIILSILWITNSKISDHVIQKQKSVRLLSLDLLIIFWDVLSSVFTLVQFHFSLPPPIFSCLPFLGDVLKTLYSFLLSVEPYNFESFGASWRITLFLSFLDTLLWSISPVPSFSSCPHFLSPTSRKVFQLKL